MSCGVFRFRVDQIGHGIENMFRLIRHFGAIGSISQIVFCSDNQFVWTVKIFLPRHCVVESMAETKKDGGTKRNCFHIAH